MVERGNEIEAKVREGGAKEGGRGDGFGERGILEVLVWGLSLCQLL